MSLILKAVQEYLYNNDVIASSYDIDELFIPPNIWISLKYDNIHIYQVLYMNGPYNPSWDIPPEDPEAFTKLLHLLKDRSNSLLHP